MNYSEGYVYHIKDSYFQKVQDDKLMQNKENGNYRPTFFCMRDESISDLLWVVPMSTRIEKYQAIYEKQVKKYGNCLTIVLGDYDNRKAAFLLQNMFPITQNYLDHIHTRNGNPVPVSYSIQQDVKSKIKQLRRMLNKGHKMVFPDIDRLQKLMMNELVNQSLGEMVQNESGQRPHSIHDRLNAATVEVARREAERTEPKQDYQMEAEIPKR